MSRTSQSASAGFEQLVAVVRELRVRCPWDQEQTLRSLSGHLVEEAYEALDAVERGDARGLEDELGDLLAQVLSNCVIAEEQRQFTLESVLTAAREKLVRRHPHVYGEVEAASSGEVVANWEKIKAQERQSVGRASALDDVAHSQPALMRAEKLGQRARIAGMDWADARAVLAKVREELGEAEQALEHGDGEAAAAEVGDMMLALANVPRFLGHKAEETLRRACDKFVERFSRVERLVAQRGVNLRELGPEQIEMLWQEAKRG